MQSSQKWVHAWRWDFMFVTSRAFTVTNMIVWLLIFVIGFFCVVKYKFCDFLVHFTHSTSLCCSLTVSSEIICYFLSAWYFVGISKVAPCKCDSNEQIKIVTDFSGNIKMGFLLLLVRELTLSAGRRAWFWFLHRSWDCCQKGALFSSLCKHWLHCQSRTLPTE